MTKGGIRILESKSQNKRASARNFNIFPPLEKDYCFKVSNQMPHKRKSPKALSKREAFGDLYKTVDY